MCLFICSDRLLQLLQPVAVKRCIIFARKLCRKFELQPSRLKFWSAFKSLTTTKPLIFFEQLKLAERVGAAMYNHGMENDVKRLDCCPHGQGHSDGFIVREC